MKKTHILPVILAAACSICPLGGRSEPTALLELKRGDHICLVGNALADRMQHSGWFESLVYSRFSDYDLVFRNLGFAGDELTVRQRSEGFGSTGDWLKHERADVVLAFFGYNESFKGPEGVEAFKKDLEKFVKETQKADFSGKGPPSCSFLPSRPRSTPIRTFPTRRR